MWLYCLFLCCPSVHPVRRQFLQLACCTAAVALMHSFSYTVSLLCCPAAQLGQFEVWPLYFDMPSGSQASLSVAFEPQEVGTHDETLVLVCDNCQVGPGPTLQVFA